MHDSFFWILMILAIVLAVNGVVATKFSDIAGMKGHDGSSYFWYVFLLGMIGMLMVVALPDIHTPSYTSVSNPKPGGWTCTCGRKHQNYETSCICGVTKASLQKNSNS